MDNELLDELHAVKNHHMRTRLVYKQAVKKYTEFCNISLEELLEEAEKEEEWLDKIKTSKTIEKNKKELNTYRNNLKPGDVTLLGLVTEGGQGLATANNGKYVGILENTKGAKKFLKVGLKNYSMR